MKTSLLCSITFLLLTVLLTADNALTSTSVETFELTSKVFGNTRTIRVLLPPDYKRAGNETRYPVFYFNDGLMVFDAKGPGLKIEQVVSDLYHKKLLPPVLFVGIDNGACTDKTKNELIDRADEFLPYPDGGFSPANTYAAEPPNPHGQKYPDFLLEEVMPEINRRYRTKTGSTNTSLGGFSYGGVSALYTVVARPAVFGRLFLESTPLWIGSKYELLNDARNAKQWPVRVYIGAGSRETDEEVFNIEGEKNQRLLAQIILKRSPQTQIKLVREKNAEHDTAAWMQRLPEALSFLFFNK